MDSQAQWSYCRFTFSFRLQKLLASRAALSYIAVGWSRSQSLQVSRNISCVEGLSGRNACSPSTSDHSMKTKDIASNLSRAMKTNITLVVIDTCEMISPPQVHLQWLLSMKGQLPCRFRVATRFSVIWICPSSKNPVLATVDGEPAFSSMCVRIPSNSIAISYPHRSECEDLNRIRCPHFVHTMDSYDPPPSLI